MFWMKKAMTAVVLAAFVLGAGVLALGAACRSENVARATEPLDGAAPPAAPDDPDALKRLEKRLADLEKEKERPAAELAEAHALTRRLKDAQAEKGAAAELGTDLALVVTEGGRGLGWSKPPYTVREVVNGRVAEMQCYDLDVLATYMTRAANDPKGPKKVRVYADQNFSHDQIHKVLAVCARAGFKTARFILPEAPLITILDPKTGKPEKAEYGQKEKTIDLAGYVDPKKP